MPGEFYELLRRAIVERRQVVAVYDGLRRELCPHRLGTKNGRLQCLFYQIGGESKSGAIVDGDEGNWRCLPLDGLSDVQIRNGDWHSAANYVKPGSCLDTVDVEVAA